MIADVETAPSCEAADRIKRALYELDLQWGSRKLDHGRIRDILNGEDRHDS